MCLYLTLCFPVALAHPALLVIRSFTTHPADPTETGQDHTYGFLGVDPQACQIITKEGDAVLGASCQGEVGAAGPRVQTHEAAGDKLAFQFAGPWLDGQRHGSLLTQVDHVGFIWNHKYKTGVKDGQDHACVKAKMSTEPLVAGECWEVKILYSVFTLLFCTDIPTLLYSFHTH